MKFTSLALCMAMAAVAAAPAAFAKDIVLKASHNANADEPYGLGMTKMGDLLSAATNGQAKIDVFANAQLGDEMESIQGTQMGTVDIAVTSNETLTNFDPDLSVFSLPFLFKDSAQMDRALADPAVIAAVSDSLKAKGFHLITFFSAGTRHIMTKKPIEQMSDLDGLKIRVMQNPAQVAAFKAFGANPTPMAYTELYGGLETGVVDGAEAANTNYYAKKFYEVAPDWAMVGWLELVAPVIMGEAEYEKLPADVKAALDKAGAEAGAYQRKIYKESDDKTFGELEAAGVKVTHPDLAAFRKAAAPIQAEYIKSDEQKKLFDLVQAVK